MHILINTEGRLSLEDHDDFKRFSIIDRSPDSNQSALHEIATPAGDNHYWIEAQSVIDLSPCAHEPSWVESFWAMLKAVEPYGYADLERKRVKAHLDSDDVS